jgi:hypothetical protein
MSERLVCRVCKAQKYAGILRKYELLAVHAKKHAEFLKTYAEFLKFHKHAGDAYSLCNFTRVLMEIYARAYAVLRACLRKFNRHASRKVNSVCVSILTCCSFQKETAILKF